jgi:trigger factor
MIGMDDEIIANYAKDMMKKEETFRNVTDKVAEEKILVIINDAVNLETKEITLEEFNKMFEEK